MENTFHKLFPPTSHWTQWLFSFLSENLSTVNAQYDLKDSAGRIILFLTIPTDYNERQEEVDYAADS